MQKNELTFSSKMGPRHSVVGETKNAKNTMANVIKTLFSESSPWSCSGSASFSYSTNSGETNLLICVRII